MKKLAALISLISICAFTADKPNIIFILADDLGYGDLGCYGQKHIRTPVLDRMCREGLKFTRFHSGSALCLPSRVVLMTGLHTGHSRVTENGGGGKHRPILEQDITIATMLKRAGYTTAMIGKWALGDHFLGCVTEHQNTDGSGALYKHGWDYYFGEPNQTYNHAYYPKQQYLYDPHGLLGKETPKNRLVPVPHPANDGNQGNVFSHDAQFERALSLLDKIGDRPFFLYLTLQIPHAPYVVPELEAYTRAAKWPEKAKAYASMISRMDRDIGRVQEKITALGLDKKTIIIFTSDNGGAGPYKEFDSNGGLPGKKGQLSDGGLRIPCIAWWPGRIKAGGTSDMLACFQDFMPTFADLAGTPAPHPIDGISLVPTLLNQGEQKQHDYLFFRLKGKERIIRNTGETRADTKIAAEAKTPVTPTF